MFWVEITNATPKLEYSFVPKQFWMCEDVVAKYICSRPRSKPGLKNHMLHM